MKQHGGEEITGMLTAGMGKATKGETKAKKQDGREKRKKKKEHRTPGGDSNVDARPTQKPDSGT